MYGSEAKVSGDCPGREGFVQRTRHSFRGQMRASRRPLSREVEAEMRASACFRNLLVLSLVLSVAHAAEPIGGWKSLRGAIYLVHGGSLAGRQLPTVEDSKLSIVFDGQSAKEIFSTIGPDLATTCSDEKGDRARSKKGITCSFTAQDKGTREGPYRCWIGIDLRTGDGIGTVSC
jgi:hypothetical protein